MGGAISVIALETRVQMDSTGRVCLVETATPIQFGQNAGHRGFNFSDSHLLESGPTRGGRQLLSPTLLLGTIRSSRRHDGQPLGGSSLTRGFDHDDDEAMTTIQIGGMRPRRSRLPLRDVEGEVARNRGRSAERASLVASERMLMLAEALFNMLEDMEEHLAHSQEPKGPQPAPAGVVDRLPMRTYEGQPSAFSSKGKGKSALGGEGEMGNAEDASLEECYVCLAEYETGDKLRTLPCMHEFHAHCVDKWLKEVHNACPLCRASVCTSRQTAPQGFESQREHLLRPTLALDHSEQSSEETSSAATTPPARAGVVVRAGPTNGGQSGGRTSHSTGACSSRRSGSASSPAACEINVSQRIPASQSTTTVRHLRSASAHEQERSQP